MSALNKYWIVTLIFTAILLSACQRNATFSASITFQGRAYVGHIDATTSLIVVDRAANNATVTCIGYPNYVKAAADGSYSLSVNTVRTFSQQNADTYTLKATSTGGDESITAQGKPGDVIQVRDFIIYKHTEE